MRGRPCVPGQLLELRGAFAKNPQRRRKDADGGEPLDIDTEPHEALSPEEVEAWRLIMETAPPNILKKADIIGLTAFARLVAEMLGGNLEVSTELRQWVVQYGMTPAARARLSVPAQKPKSKFSEFKAA